MSLLLALLLVIHGGVHIGYLCSRSWPFEATDSWLVTGVGAGPDTVQAVGVALVLVTFLGFVLAAPATFGTVLPSRLWAPLVVIGSIASAVVLVMFVTPATVPFLAVDAILLWATLVQGWRPASQRRRADDRRERAEGGAGAR